MTTPDTTPTHRDGPTSPRVYSEYGKTAHNVWDIQGQQGSCIYCRREKPPGGWKGMGSDKERAHALKLPYCKEKL